MNRKNMLNVPKIQEAIRKKHKTFMDEVGYIPIKISADRQLAVTRLSSRITQILSCLISEKVIDLFTPCNLPESLYSHRGFHLIKKGYEKSVFIWTDGNDIVFTDSSFLIRTGLFNSHYEIFRDIDIDEYNWEEFTDSLLGYIHMVIYERQIAYEKAIWKDQNDESDSNAHS